LEVEGVYDIVRLCILIVFGGVNWNLVRWR
jgi:hypothetical protein